MWDTLTGLGFDGGRVLEPGAGAGTFIGLAPTGADLVGVELDPSTAAVARALYPHAEIRTESFAETLVPDGWFDAVIGNVPFADVRLHDPRHNRGGHSLHNHFLLKSLALTRPGGLVVALTSHWTLDAQNPAARREINQVADLVGAVRLPTGAHRRAAGTDVITDLLVLRRREPGEPPRSRGWETTRSVELDGGSVRVNEHFLEHPDRVLGEQSIVSGQYGTGVLRVTGPLEQTAPRLRGALNQLVAEARAAGLSATPRAPDRGAAAAVATASPELWDGHIAAHPNGSFSTVLAGVHEPLEVPRSQHRELRALLELRDGARELLTAEASSLEDTAAIDALRGRLADAYAAYADRYGPINRFTLRATGREDPQTGQPRMSRVTPRVMATLRSDPFAALVGALEVFDESSQTATPATLLSERVVVPRTPVLGVENPDDALAVCLETRGRVELPTIAALLGVDEQGARAQLGERVYRDPAAGELVTAAEYLSGNVREKLQLAEAAAQEDPVIAVNVQALRAVLPADLGMEDVEARLGAAWIDTDAHRAFLAEVLDDESIRVEHPGGAIWEVKGDTHSVAATSQWGTARMASTAIAKATLEQRPVQVTDDAGDGKRVLNPVETAAAQEKAQALQERFAEWVWEEPERATRLLAEYNRRFNCLVLRDYSTEGDRLTLPGLTRTFQPRAHQRAAVARMLAEPAVGLFHAVGAGKTAEMVIGTMELKRLGMATKPAVVVPNHMLEQFSREWLQLYPQARLLAASSQDLAGEKRRAFVARVATNDWDAVVLTRTAFERLPLSEQAQADYVTREIDALRAMLDGSRGGQGLTVKRLERMVMAGEERLAARLDGPRDPGIVFEQTGIDYLVVDEVHDYKNLRTASNIRDAAIDGSKRSSDLHMKTEYLRSRHGDRVITAATATPIANSVTEAHVMQRLLRPDLLRDAGVEDFDSWAATFGQTVTEIEMAPTGGGSYRMQTRFARFQNVPEMLRMWHVFADVKTPEDLKLPTPELAEREDGERLPHTIVIEASPEVSAYVSDLGARAEQVRSRSVAPEEDNMLKISTDGRKAALDMRMVSDQPSTSTSKLDVAAEQIAGIWRQSRQLAYRDPATGEASPTPGALQLVFCDLGTPSATWNAYDALRDQLVDQGLPPESVRFIHEARNDIEKARLFAAARAGQIAVLLGSTQKMGVGTNIQARAIALHHLDCPWRPADVEQRDGRIMRQGNQNPEVAIYRYVVEGSFDAYSWQTVERKARFIAQIMRGRLDMRAMDDIGDSALSFAEVKALASGDPLVLQKAQADSELTRLQRLQRAYQRNQQALTTSAAGARATHARTGRQLPAITAAIGQRRETRAEAFAMLVAGQHTRSRTDAGQLLAHEIARLARGGIPYGHHTRALGDIGELGGLRIGAELRHTGGRAPTVEVTIAEVPSAPATAGLDTIHDSGASLVRQLENRIADLPLLADRVERDGAAAASEAQKADEALKAPFKHAGALTGAQERVTQITAAMQQRQHQAAAPSASSEGADPEPSAAAPPAIDEDLAALQRLTRASFPQAPGAAADATAGPRPPRAAPSPMPSRPKDHER
ncbi:MAG: helicase [Propionibacteriales bacterium]|nr:helicase [Propionibacteriales bacterium]